MQWKLRQFLQRFFSSFTKTWWSTIRLWWYGWARAILTILKLTKANKRNECDLSGTNGKMKINMSNTHTHLKYEWFMPSKNDMICLGEQNEHKIIHRSRVCTGRYTRSHATHPCKCTTATINTITFAFVCQGNLSVGIWSILFCRCHFELCICTQYLHTHTHTYTHADFIILTDSKTKLTKSEDSQRDVKEIECERAEIKFKYSLFDNCCHRFFYLRLLCPFCRVLNVFHIFFPYWIDSYLLTWIIWQIFAGEMEKRHTSESVVCVLLCTRSLNNRRKINKNPKIFLFAVVLYDEPKERTKRKEKQRAKRDRKN